MSDIPAYERLCEMARIAESINGEAMHQARKMRLAEFEARRNDRARAAALCAAGRDQPGRVYFAECGDFIKIGYTTLSVDRRITDLSTGNPLPFSVLLVVKANPAFEKNLHKRFASIRHRGEWFEKHPDLLALIAELKAATI